MGNDDTREPHQSCEISSRGMTKRARLIVSKVPSRTGWLIFTSSFVVAMIYRARFPKSKTQDGETINPRGWEVRHYHGKKRSGYCLYFSPVYRQNYASTSRGARKSPEKLFFPSRRHGNLSDEKRAGQRLFLLFLPLPSFQKQGNAFASRETKRAEKYSFHAPGAFDSDGGDNFSFSRIMLSKKIYFEIIRSVSYRSLAYATGKLGRRNRLWGSFLRKLDLSCVCSSSKF